MAGASACSLEMEENYTKTFGLRLEARLKNSALVEAREKLGLTVEKASEQIGLGYGTYGNYERLTLYPSKETQHKICDFYRNKGAFLLEEDVFPEELKKLSKNISKKYIAKKELTMPEIVSLSTINPKSLPSPDINLDDDKKYITQKVEEALKMISPQQAKVIRLRYGFASENEETYREIGKTVKVSQERARQILIKAERRMQRILGRDKEITNL